MKEEKIFLLQYVLQLADNAMILGQRLGEMCGHGPILEQDIALTNISLDLIGEARILYQYASEIEGDGKTEDDYPYKRDVLDWKNLLLVEQPNGHFGYTIVRQFLFDCYHYYHLKEMRTSSDERLAEIAKKTFKEATYHLKYSSEWMIRLGDGTAESHQKIQEALNDLIPYFQESLIKSKVEHEAALEGICVDLEKIKSSVIDKFTNVCEEATLSILDVEYPQKGGKNGYHSEHLGYILSDLQFLQRAYPNSTW